MSLVLYFRNVHFASSDKRKVEVIIHWFHLVSEYIHGGLFDDTLIQLVAKSVSLHTLFLQSGSDSGIHLP